jgi:P27 family predicted phage terminase small subunit
LKERASAPKALTSEARRIYRRLCRAYGIDDEGGFEILRTGLEAWDRMRQVHARIEADGVTFTDRFGQVKAHPLLSVERDARAQYLAALKALNLDVEPLRDRPGRPGSARDLRFEPLGGK